MMNSAELYLERQRLRMVSMGVYIYMGTRYSWTHRHDNFRKILREHILSIGKGGVEEKYKLPKITDKKFNPAILKHCKFFDLPQDMQYK